LRLIWVFLLFWTTPFINWFQILLFENSGSTNFSTPPPKFQTISPFSLVSYSMQSSHNHFTLQNRHLHRQNRQNHHHFGHFSLSPCYLYSHTSSTTFSTISKYTNYTKSKPAILGPHFGCPNFVLQIAVLGAFYVILLRLRKVGIRMSWNGYQKDRRRHRSWSLSWSFLEVGGSLLWIESRNGCGGLREWFCLVFWVGIGIGVSLIDFTPIAETKKSINSPQNLTDFHHILSRNFESKSYQLRE